MAEVGPYEKIYIVKADLVFFLQLDTTVTNPVPKLCQNFKKVSVQLFEK